MFPNQEGAGGTGASHINSLLTLTEIAYFYIVCTKEPVWVLICRPIAWTGTRSVCYLVSIQGDPWKTRAELVWPRSRPAKSASYVPQFLNEMENRFSKSALTLKVNLWSAKIYKVSWVKPWNRQSALGYSALRSVFWLWWCYFVIALTDGVSIFKANLFQKQWPPSGGWNCLNLHTKFPNLLSKQMYFNYNFLSFYSMYERIWNLAEL